MASRGHARSNSFPTRSHPAAVNIEDHLCILRSADTTCSSTSSICRNLASLSNLHERLQDLIQLPSIQQELSTEPSKKWADGILDGSVRLLDVCGTTKDILLHLKESVKELESALRRNRGAESSVAHDVDAYATSKKKVNKMITKCIKSLQVSTPVNREGNHGSTVAMLGESEVISFSILKSVLVYLSGSKNGSKQRGWSFVNKMVQSKRIHCDIEQEQEGNIEDALSALIKYKSCKESKAATMQKVVKQLRMMEVTIQELEELLETIFKSLINRRVSLLNILNH